MSDVCAVDFTPTSVQLLVRRRSGQTAATEATLPAEAIEDGKVLQPTAVHFYLERMMKQLQVKRARIRLTVSDAACVTRVIEYPRMPKAALERSMRLELGRELPMNPTQVYTGWHIVHQDDSRVAVLLVAAWRDAVESYLEAVAGLGRVTVVEPRSLALARAVGMKESLLLDWSDDRLQVARVLGGCVTYTTSVQMDASDADSCARIVHTVRGVLPKQPADHDDHLRMVLLGKLHGREDVAGDIEGGAGLGDAITDWRPPSPYEDYAASSQVANVGMLMRN